MQSWEDLDQQHEQGTVSDWETCSRSAVHQEATVRAKRTCRFYQ